MANKKGEKIGTMIKRHRLEKGLTQEELARLANLKLSNLAKLEGNFNSNPTLFTLRSLAKVLTNNSLDDLLGR